MKPFRGSVWISVALAAVLASGCGSARKIAKDGEARVYASAGTVVAAVGAPEQLTFSDSDNGIANYAVNGESVVYQSNRNGNWQIYELNLNDFTERRLLESEFNDENPVWIPDGEGIIFVSDRDGGGEFERNIYFYSPAEGIVTPLTNQPGDEWYPVPVDNTFFVYLEEPADQPDVPVALRPNYLMAAGYFSGEGSRQVAGMDINATSPAPMGDGRLIIRAPDDFLAVYDPMTGGIDRLTPQEMQVGNADYHIPSGLLAFTGKTDGEGYQLFFYDIQGRVFQRVETDKADIRYPRISPDGGWVLFSAEQDGLFQLFRVSVQRQ